MKANNMWKFLTILSIGLWVFTGIYFFAPTFGPSELDTRISIDLNKAEKNMVLSEMRQLLKGVHGIIKAVSEDNIKEAAMYARGNGMVMASEAGHHPGLIAKLPMNFKKLGFGLHKSFDDLADRAESMSGNEILKETSKIMNSCLNCHSMYRVK